MVDEYSLVNVELVYLAIQVDFVLRGGFLPGFEGKVVLDLGDQKRQGVFEHLVLGYGLGYEVDPLPLRLQKAVRWRKVP